MIKTRAQSGLSRMEWIEHMARLDEARRRGKCGQREGELLHLNPYTDPDYARAWRDSWIQSWLERPTA